jgi:hypothetical protein
VIGKINHVIETDRIAAGSQLWLELESASGPGGGGHGWLCGATPARLQQPFDGGFALTTEPVQPTAVRCDDGISITPSLGQTSLTRSWVQILYALLRCEFRFCESCAMYPSAGMLSANCQLKSAGPYLKMELIGSRNISSLAAMVRLQGDCENETFIADRRRRLRIRSVTDAIRLGNAPRNSR